MKIRVVLAGASPKELDQGLLAVLTFFSDVKVDPARAAVGAFLRHQWQAGRQDEMPSEEEMLDASAWDEAQKILERALSGTVAASKGARAVFNLG